ncbi:MAG: CaiB/BaiF CoA transferase family protein [Dehalococcoidia bacterium]
MADATDPNTRGTEASGALDGIRVLACTQIVAGPFAGIVLSDFGAEVVKLEPLEGEGYRNSGAVVPKEGKRFQSLNRGQKSLAIDLSKPEGRAAIQRIIPSFDVILINYRPGVPERMGIGYEELAAIHPGLIYCNITGFGETGPWADRGATDLVASAYSGLVAGDDKMTEEGEPAQLTPAISDYVTGLACVASINAALYHRQKTGLGQRIDGALLRSALAIQDVYIMRQAVTDATLRDPMVAQVNDARAHGATYEEVLRIRRDYRWAGAGPPRLYYNGYNCSDGQIVLGCLTKATRDGARRVLGMEHDRTDDAAFDPWDEANKEQVREWKRQVQATIRAHPVSYWIERFTAEGVPVAPVQIPEELSDDQHVRALGVMVDFDHPITGPQTVVGPMTKMSLTPTRAQGPSPALGDHTAETLRKGGLTDAEIAGLRASGVILQRE